MLDSQDSNSTENDQYYPDVVHNKNNSPTEQIESVDK